ncbi:hypothetical protein GE253_16960 [Niveispirillum sp. SYP-B3756]|uniref:hypothetical protein n=1 Tax=Niveispirillum sp. SYP-B3756 TaxID=2662178 RepID=UPI001291F534|nr:hypothetical protein [Niveispirillum sp. SYP-B3756]MQP67020.1 hypothetical protein [Niveispirillum sp. SYP-B3756]
MTGQRLPDRRRLLRGLLAGGLCLALVDTAPAQASEAVDPKIRFIKFPPILLPGKDRLAYLRLRFTLVVREGEKMQQEADLVNAYKPRIIGLVTERLPQDNVVDRDSGPEQVNHLKEWLRDLANTIVGQPVVEEALIVSILTG